MSYSRTARKSSVKSYLYMDVQDFDYTGENAPSGFEMFCSAKISIYTDIIKRKDLYFCL